MDWIDVEEVIGSVLEDSDVIDTKEEEWEQTIWPTYEEYCRFKDSEDYNVELMSL